MEQWKKFDYENPPAEGIYWVVVNALEYDVDVDGDGSAIGTPTGKIKADVCMAAISVDVDGRVQFDTVDRWAFGQVADEDVVSFYSEVVKPAAPPVPQVKAILFASSDLSSLEKAADCNPSAILANCNITIPLKVSP